mgnify:CR=1 FL=1
MNSRSDHRFQAVAAAIAILLLNLLANYLHMASFRCLRG